MNHDYCAANESLTIQMASQVYGIDTTANGLCFYEYGQAAYFTRRNANALIGRSFLSPDLQRSYLLGLHDRQSMIRPR